MRIITYIVVILFAPTLILANYRALIYSQNFYSQQFVKLGVYQNFESASIVDIQSTRLIRYFCCNQPLDATFYSEKEILHLKDVKGLIGLANFQLVVNIVILTSLFVVLLTGRKATLAIIALKWGSLASVIAVITLWLASLAKFDLLFTKFHQISFSNDFWLLPENSSLIKMFPPQFFANFANTIAIRTLLISVFTLLASVLLGRKFDTKSH